MRGRNLTEGRRYLHVIWLTHDESDADPPQRFARFWESARRVFPDREHVVWGDSDAAAVVARWGKETFFHHTLRTPVERSDVLRMMILHDFGGVYVDVDVEFMEAPPLVLDRPVNLLRSPLFSEEFQSCLMVANTAGHWLWKDCVGKIEANFENLEKGKEAAVVRALLANPLTSSLTRMALTVFLTGPPNIDKTIASRFDDCRGQIAVLPDSCYCGPVAVHHEAGSWTIFSRLARLRDFALFFAKLLFNTCLGLPNIVAIAMIALYAFGF